jgi:hypothetical protein
MVGYPFFLFTNLLYYLKSFLTVIKLSKTAAHSISASRLLHVSKTDGMLSIDEADEPIQRYTWFTVLTNITNDFNSIHTAHKSIVSCQETNVIAHRKNSTILLLPHTINQVF